MHLLICIMQTEEFSYHTVQVLEYSSTCSVYWNRGIHIYKQYVSMSYLLDTPSTQDYMYDIPGVRATIMVQVVILVFIVAYSEYHTWYKLLKHVKSLVKLVLKPMKLINYELD